jgi:hypothetical protein
MIQRILIITACLISIAASGQLIDSSFQAKMLLVNRKAPKRPTTEWMLEFKTTGPFCEIMKLPSKPVYSKTLEYTFNDDGLLVGIAGITVEPKLNLFPGKQGGFFLKTPISFSVSVTYPGDYHKTWGCLNLDLPCLAGYGRGLNSVSSSTSLNGYALSVGYQLLVGPLLGAKRERFDFGRYKPRRTWIMPLIGFDYYWMTKKEKPHGISLLISPTQLYFKTAWSFRTVRPSPQAVQKKKKASL